MNYDEYIREGHVLYESFAGTVAAILRAAIDDSDEPCPGYEAPPWRVIEDRSLSIDLGAAPSLIAR